MKFRSRLQICLLGILMLSFNLSIGQVYIEKVVPEKHFILVEMWNSAAFEVSPSREKGDVVEKMKDLTQIKRALRAFGKNSDFLLHRDSIDEKTLFVSLRMDSVFHLKSLNYDDVMDDDEVFNEKVKIYGRLEFKNYLGGTVIPDKPLMIYHKHYGSYSNLMNVLPELYDYGISSTFAAIFAKGLVNEVRIYENLDTIEVLVDTIQLSYQKTKVNALDDIRKNTLLVHGGKFNMTAQVFSDKGWFFTDSRTFNEKDTIDLVDHLGDTLQGVLIRENKCTGVTLGKLVSDSIPFKSLMLAENHTYQIGDDVLSFSTVASELGQSYCQGKITQYSDHYPNQFKSNLFYQLGCSGGAIFNKDLELIGVGIIDNVDYRNNPIFTCYEIMEMLNDLNLEQ